MSFESTIIQFHTPTELSAYLGAFKPPVWGPIGSTIHNTYRPLESDWRGYATMLSMRADYINKGWSAGPHFYVCVGAPNPANDGIWQMTAPIHEGVHAGPCNGSRFGIEVVGDFQTRHWSTGQRALLLEALTVVHRWAHLSADLVGHRDCMAGRTCPGQAAYDDLPALRVDLAAALTVSRSATVLGAAVYQRRDCTGPVARYARPGDVVRIDRDYGDGIVHLADGSGFMRSAELQ